MLVEIAEADVVGCASLAAVYTEEMLLHGCCLDHFVIPVMVRVFRIAGSSVGVGVDPFLLVAFGGHIASGVLEGLVIKGHVFGRIDDAFLLGCWRLPCHVEAIVHIQPAL